ncbi:hypothetical protein [Phocoenobacter skyensis]|uniref:Uncharacterized protein n=1 Tax=Phocoenobacter skyensis TaxID=97481 RepID=A0A1H7W4X2_9PAST|nr:hypothetical protein [Pasteurella skyensis]MDP8079113.1 hypothetical protein [Pasteurella skyensis]MDP8085063.1 hypothetical protein [Pasteurella skyensis]MDP8185037.1 hypothetical protein [Pasteurella skyensis]QLB23093.1 hypothetical protein A6B44_07710 [Pasteurella skyensis]SEM16576.1 hypothetical protein SAMN05444853_10715 [Pasteurella skyensis]
MYALQSNLEKFGKTLQLYQDKHTNYETQDATIKKLSLKCNLVDIFTKIFEKMTFSDRSIELLDNHLEQFNTDNGGEKLTKKDLLNLGWVRIIFNQIYIPTQIAYSLNSYRQQNSTLSENLTAKQRTAIKFLLTYQSKIAHNGVISITDVETIIANTECSIKDIEELDIFTIKDDNFIYDTTDCSKSIKFIAKDILLNFYYQTCDETNPTLEQVRDFIQITNKLKFYFYLPDFVILFNNDEFFRKLKQLIDNELDLNSSNIERLKYILDNPRQNYDTSFDTKNYQNFTIDASNTINIIYDIDYFNKYYHSSCGFMKNSRRIYGYIIQSFLKLGECMRLEDFELKKYLTNPSKPYLTYKIYQNLKDSHIDKFPQIILEDNNFIPLIFSELTKFEVSEEALYNYEAIDPYRIHEKDSHLEELKTELCVTFFKICFNQDTFQVTCNDISPLANTLIYFAKESLKDSASCAKAHKHLRFEQIFSEFERFTQSIYEEQETTSIHEIIKNIADNFTNHDKANNLISIDYATILLLSKLIELDKSYDNNEKIISTLVCEHLKWLFSYTEVTVFDYETGRECVVKADIYTTACGLELVNWNTIFAIIYKNNKLDEIYSALIQNLKFDQSKTHSFDELHKVELLYKMCCLAYSKKHNETIRISDVNYHEFYIKLEQLIMEVTQEYHNEDIARFKNLFKVPHKFLQNRYYKTTRECLFDFINCLDFEKSQQVLTNLFDDSNDLGLMLEAIHALENTTIKESISERINTIDPTEYIDNHVFLIDELKQSMIYAVNSSSNYLLAKKFLERIVQHHRKRKYDEKGVKYLAKRIELLIALKSKDVEEIRKFRNDIAQISSLSFVYEAVFHIDETRDYTLAEKLLKKIDKSDVFDILARFDLFRCIALNPDKSLPDKQQAVDDWKNYIETLNDNSNEHIFINKYASYINSYITTVYGQIDNEKDNFYDYFRKVESPHRFNEYLLEVVINRLTSDKRFIEYNTYITDAEKYYDERSENMPKTLVKALNKSLSKANKDELRNTVSLIHKLKPKDVIHVVPNNDFNDLGSFVLYSILSSIKLMMEKTHAIREKQSDGSYKVENQYNDLVKVILSARLEYLNWQVTDQERTGISANDRDAGEADIIIKHKNNTFALIEAFRLKGGDKSTTQPHSNKVNSYAPNISNYYNLIYYIGDGDVDDCWRTYQDDFLETDFVEPLENPNDFQELSDEFPDFLKMRIAKTIHGNHNYFHIMVDLSDYEHSNN